MEDSCKKTNNIDIKHLTGIILLFLLGVAYYFIKKYTGISMVCVSNQMFGIKCLGCGNTRMIMSIMEFDFYHAFRYNMVVFTFLPVILYVTIRGIWEYIHGVNYVDCYICRFCTKHYKVIVVIIIVWTILRNIPCFEVIDMA